MHNQTDINCYINTFKSVNGFKPTSIPKDLDSAMERLDEQAQLDNEWALLCAELDEELEHLNNSLFNEFIEPYEEHHVY